MWNGVLCANRFKALKFKVFPSLFTVLFVCVKLGVIKNCLNDRCDVFSKYRTTSSEEVLNIDEAE